MKIFRLTRKDYDGEVVFGIPSEICTDSDKKINSYLTKYRPYDHCIPYYKKAKFGFLSLNALCTFLFANNENEFTEEELKEVNNNYVVQTYELDTWSKGLSKFMCTYFDDEVLEGPIDTYSINDLMGYTFKFIYQTNVPKEDIALVKEQYYSKVKFH